VDFFFQNLYHLIHRRFGLGFKSSNTPFKDAPKLDNLRKIQTACLHTENSVKYANLLGDAIKIAYILEDARKLTYKKMQENLLTN
jgi:hypothetical protein